MENYAEDLEALEVRASLPMQKMKMLVTILGSKDPWREEMAMLSSVLAWVFMDRGEEPGGLQSGVNKSLHDWKPLSWPRKAARLVITRAPLNSEALTQAAAGLGRGVLPGARGT